MSKFSYTPPVYFGRPRLMGRSRVMDGTTRLDLRPGSLPAIHASLVIRRDSLATEKEINFQEHGILIAVIILLNST